MTASGTETVNRLGYPNEAIGIGQSTLGLLSMTKRKMSDRVLPAHSRANTALRTECSTAGASRFRAFAGPLRSSYETSPTLEPLSSRTEVISSPLRPDCRASVGYVGTEICSMQDADALVAVCASAGAIAQSTAPKAARIIAINISTLSVEDGRQCL